MLSLFSDAVSAAFVTGSNSVHCNKYYALFCKDTVENCCGLYF